MCTYVCVDVKVFVCENVCVYKCVCEHARATMHPSVLRTPVSASCLRKGALGFVGGAAGNQQVASSQQIGTRDYFGSG